MNGQVERLNAAFRADGITTRSLDRLLYVGGGAALAIALALGMFGRLRGLGDYALAVDEYYFIQGVKAILKHGIPSLDTGDVYVRGLFPQYLTALSILVFGDNGFAYRLPAALFSIATVPLAYIYGKRLFGMAGGVALAVFLLISAWEIEFGRFARMYSALQFVTLLFFVAIDKACDNRRPPWVYFPHVVVILALYTHEFGIFLTPFLLVPWLSLWDQRRTGRVEHWFRFALVSSAIVLVCYRIYMLQDRIAWAAVRNPYPADLAADLVTGPRSRWRWPFSPFFGEPYAEILVYVGLGVAAAIVCIALVCRFLGKSFREGDLLGSLLLLAAVLHQFLIAGLVLLVMAARYRTAEFGRRRLQVILALAISVGVLWVAYALSSREWIAETFRPEYGFSPNYGLVKGLVRVFLGWPVIIDTAILPWLTNLPLISTCAIAAALYQLITKAHAGLVSWARNPIIFISFFVLILGVANSAYSSIRYSFFIYPLLLALVLLSSIEAARAVVHRWGGDRRLGTLLGVAACTVMFIASSDFRLRQITEVANPSVRFRLGEFERYQEMWYFRWDYESPARYINERSALHDGEKVVVAGEPPVSFYLRRSHAVYYDRRSNLFYDHSRAGGTIDRWSNQRFLSTPADLREYTKCAATVWIVRPVSSVRPSFKDEEVWQERLIRTEEVSRSIDDRLAVIRAELQPASGC